jgi:hypothetical protein
MHPAGKPVPAENPQAEEGGFEEEREQGLDSERRTENVTDEPGISRPVHTKLEFLDNARDDTHGEVDQEQLAVEPGQLEPAVVTGAEPGGLEPGHKERETDRYRHEEEVVNRRDPELPAGQVEQAHRRPPFVWITRSLCVHLTAGCHAGSLGCRFTPADALMRATAQTRAWQAVRAAVILHDT